ncbi:MAG: Dabb family protein [bacterium]|jgi:hypothetical protein
MTHYVLLKFQPNYLNKDIFEYINNTFQRIKEQIQNIENVNVYMNCVERDSNMDIMIEMDLADEDTLYTYLEHELHRAFVSVVDEHVVLKVSFDCE